MSHRFKIEQLGEFVNQEIVSDHLVIQKELREGSKGKYLRLALADSTGTITANIWNNAESFDSKFDNGDGKNQSSSYYI